MPENNLLTKSGIGLSVIFMLGGCASQLQVGRYQTFSSATANIHSSASETYSRIEIKQRNFSILSAPNLAITVDTFKPLINGQSFDITDALNKRAAVLDVLASYGKALEALASKDAGTDVDAAAQNLSASLIGIGGIDTVLSNAFASILDEAARNLTNAMRRDALKKAMTSAQPGIEKLSELIQKDNQRIGLFVQLIRDSYIKHANLARPAYGTNERYKSDLEVATTLEEFQQIQNSLTSSSKAASSLPTAHRELLESLDNQSSRLNSLSELVAEAKHLNGFYKNLATN